MRRSVAGLGLRVLRSNVSRTDRSAVVRGLAGGVPGRRAPGHALSRGRSGNPVSDGLSRGLEVAGQVGAAASEMVRTRRDPALIALRRRRAARRRLTVWGAGTVIGVAGSTSSIVAMTSQGLTAMLVFTLLVCLALVGWAGGGALRAVRDLRVRTRRVHLLPPPQPARPAVAGEVRPLTDRLNRMSDELRGLVSMIGIVEDDHMIALRRDVIGTADAAERHLRRLARELTGVLRSRRTALPEALPALTVTVERLSAELREGVGEYGALVTATTEAVAASRQLSARVFELPEVTDRLQALAGGMRELAEG